MSVKDAAKAGGAGLGMVVLVLGAIIGTSFLGFFLYSFFAPKYEGVRRDVMIESRYYSEVTVRRLYDLKRQYETETTPTAKQTIAMSARHEFSIFPQDRLPADLRVWMAQIGR